MTLTVNVAEQLPAFVREPNPEIYRTGVPLFLDFETTNLDKGSALNPHNRIVLACWQLGWDGEVQHKWGNEFEQQELLECLREADFLVAHNAKFESQWLARCGLELQNLLLYDTMLAEYVVGGNRWKTNLLSLDACAKRNGIGGKLSVVSRMIKAGIPTEDIPQAWLLRYCQQDVHLLSRLMRRQLQTISPKLLPVVYSRCMLTPVLADLETNGMALDAELINSLASTLETRLVELESQTNRRASGVNLNSPKQMAAFLYDQLGFAEPTIRRRGTTIPDRTPSGLRKTDGDTVAALECTTAQQREFKALFEEARDVGQQLSKYLRKFSECVRDNAGVLYAAFHQTQTFTHRLSSSGAKYKVQFQNFPRAYKKFFRAKRPGWLVGEADGAQLEFRAAGHLGRDEAIKRDVADGVDVHRVTADTMTDAGQYTERQEAKPHTFKPLYGGQSGTEAEKAYYQYFREKYPGIAAAQSRWIDRVLTDKLLETEWGLVYYWPDTRMDRSGYITNTTSICNYPVQAFATAEIIPFALICMWHRLKRSTYQMQLVNTVHDSIIAELPPEEQQAFHDLARQCMIYDAEDMVRRLYGIELFVPLGCGVKIGEHWGVGDEFKYER